MKQITSKDNQIIKHIIKLKDKKYRNEYNEFIIEGIKILKEAIEEKVKIKNIIVSESTLNSELFEKNLNKELKGKEFILVPDYIFKLLSDVEKPQGVMAIIEKDTKNTILDFSQDLILVLEDIQDPGNLGTIIRTADSVGLTQILVTKGTIDCYNSKVIRSTMGAIFRVKIIETDDLAEKIIELQKNNFKVITTSLQASKSIYDINLNKSAIIIGNEANGVSKSIQELADIKAIIPMKGKTESLNVSIATGVILYEFIRQNL